MAIEDVIEEPVIVEPVVEIEPTKDEAILLEIQKSKQEALEAKKLVEDMKALLEAKEKNEKTVQELLAEERVKNENLVKLADENAEWAKKVKESNDLATQQKAEL